MIRNLTDKAFLQTLHDEWDRTKRADAALDWARFREAAIGKLSQREIAALLRWEAGHRNFDGVDWKD